MKSELKFIVKTLQSNSKFDYTKISNYDQEKIVYLLEENRVLQPFLEKINLLDNEKLASLQSKINSVIKQDYVEDIDKKTEIFSNFMKNLEIDWMSHKHLFFERQRADIDVLVPSNKFGFVIEKLEDNGFEKISIEPSKIKLTKPSDNSNFTIHVHEKIIWETEFIDTTDVWNRSRVIKDKNISIRIPEAEDSILIECAHAFFESRLIRLSDVLQFLALVNREPIDWKKVSSRMKLYGFQSAGYLYFLAMNKIISELFEENPIPNNFLDDVYSSINSEEKFFSVSHAKKKILTNQELLLPFPISLVSSALIFISFNRHKGMNDYFHSLNVISSAALRHLEVKLGLRKL